MNKRIRLKKGVQKNLINTAKRQSGLSWKELGKLAKVSGNYLRLDLKNEKNILSQKVYLNLCRLAKKRYDLHIVSQLNSNWGQIKGGRKAPGSTPKKPKLLANKYSKELAEIIGVMLGDGNSWSGRRGYYYIRVAGNSKNDKNYLINYVKPLFKKVFGIDMQVLYYYNQNEIFLHKGSKDLVFTFEKLGFPPGDKIKNKVKIPNWVFKSKSYLRACIRGLIDTDGCVCPITNRNYPYIWFKSHNAELRNSFSKAMQVLGFKIAKWSSNKSSQTFIGSKSLIRKYFKEIGFANPYHKKRYEEYAPVV